MTISERKQAAIHIRARDLREGDVIVGEGRIRVRKTLENNDVYVYLDRQAFNSQTYRPRAIVLIELGPDD